MKLKINKKLYSLTSYLEILIGFVIVIAIVISMAGLYEGLKDLIRNPTNGEVFRKFLGIAFNIIIGLEFLKMLTKSNLSTVVEVLLFAIARQLIVEHTSVFENCIGIVSIAILFVVRKFLFIPQLDSEEESHQNK